MSDVTDILNAMGSIQTSTPQQRDAVDAQIATGGGRQRTGGGGVSLNALSISLASATVGSAFSATIGGRNAGSSLALTGAGADGLSLSGTTVSGTPTTVGSVGVTETLAGATNSPRTTNNLISVTAATPAPSFGGPASQSLVATPSSRQMSVVPGATTAATTPTTAAFNPGSQTLDMRVQMRCANWSTMRGTILCQWTTSLAGQSYVFYFDDSSRPAVAYQLSSGIVAAFAPSPVTFPRWATRWLRVLVDPVAGRAQFFTSPDNVTWTSIGLTTTGLGSGAIVAPAAGAVLSMGNYGGGGPTNTRLSISEVFETQMLIGGTLVANPRFNDAAVAPAATSFTDGQSRPWTLAGDAVLTETRPVRGNATRFRGGVILQAKEQWPFWGGFWSEWNWDGFIKPQIDGAKAVGFNSIQINGDGINDNTGNYPNDTVFRQRVEQVCAYARSIGLAVFWQLGFRPAVSFGPDGQNLAAGIASSAKVAGWVNSIDNVIALDVMNEWDLSPVSTWGGGTPNAQALSDIRQYINAIRAVFKKPLTCSVATLNLPWAAPIAPYVDFHDFHNYDWQYKGDTYQATQADLGPMKSQAWWRDAFVLGETGMPLDGVAPGGKTFTSTDRRNWFTSVNTQLQDADSLGGLQWGVYPTTGTPTGAGLGLRVGKWGSITDTFAVLPEVSEPVAAWPAQL